MIFKSIRTQLLGLVVATAVPLTALSAGGLWSQWQSDQAEAIRRAREEARLLALQVDDHFSNLETLLLGLARSVSTDPADAAANDQLLRQVKSELPSFISILVFSPDGTNIGTSGEFRERINVRDRDYFQQILAGKQLSIGNVVRGRSSGQWFVTIARAINDPDGNLRGVILVGPQLEHFQNALRMQALPPDSVVRIVNDQGIVVARSLNAADWIGRDLSKFDHGASPLTSGKSAHIALWSYGVERNTG